MPGYQCCQYRGAKLENRDKGNSIDMKTHEAHEVVAW